MRARNIKPGFFKCEDLAECCAMARLLFAGLWCLADREGRLEDRPKRIKAEVFPFDNCDIEELLGQLVKHKFITRYEVSDDLKVIQVINFVNHQHPHVKESPSQLPAEQKTKSKESLVLDPEFPALAQESLVLAPEIPALARLIPDSLIPDSLIPDSGFRIPDSGPVREIPEQATEIPEQATEIPEQATERFSKRDFSDSPEGVAQEFKRLQSPKHGETEQHIAESIRSMIAAGYVLAAIRDEVRNPDRDRGEFWWQVKKRLEYSRGNSNIRPNSRVGLAANSHERIAAKTIRCGKTPDYEERKTANCAW